MLYVMLTAVLVRVFTIFTDYYYYYAVLYREYYRSTVFIPKVIYGKFYHIPVFLYARTPIPRTVPVQYTLSARGIYCSYEYMIYILFIL